MNKNIENVVILGAGASKGIAGVPIQSEFWKAIENYINENGLAVYHKALIDRVKNSGRYENYIKDFDFSSIEKLFSCLHELTYLSKNQEVKSAALELTLFYRLIIVKYLLRFKYDKKEFKDYSLLKEWACSDNTVFINLNFDELFEYNILKNEVYYYGFDNLPYGEDLNINGKKFQTLKLHGSISWWEKRNLKGLSFYSDDPPEFYRYNIEKLKDIKDSNNSDNLKHNPIYPALALEPQNNNYVTAITPVIIPFYQQKMEWYTKKWGIIFTRIYKRCAEVLSNCKNIYIVGYSMPPADWTVRRLLTGCKENENLKEVKVFLPPKNFYCDDRCCSCKDFNEKEKDKSEYKPDAMEEYEKIFSSSSRKVKVEYIPKCIKKILKNEISKDK